MQILERNRHLIGPACIGIVGGVILGIVASRIGPIWIGIASGIAFGIVAYRRAPLAR